jgi:hypothetical protein
MSDDWNVKKVFLGETGLEKKSRKIKIMWLDCIAIDLTWMVVKIKSNTAEDRNASALIPKEVLVKLGHATATGQKVAASFTDGAIGTFHWHFFRQHYGPGFDSASKRNEYQEYFLWGKGGRCIGLTTLPPS